MLLLPGNSHYVVFFAIVCCFVLITHGSESWYTYMFFNCWLCVCDSFFVLNLVSVFG